MRVLGDSDRDITFNDILEMKYLERCLMETLRLYPPVPIIARQPKKEFKLGNIFKTQYFSLFFFFTIKTENKKLIDCA